jgi:signal transduction histidine kinase
VKLYWRIVLPFALGLVLVTVTGTLLGSYLLGWDADRRLEAHLGSVAQRIAEAGFALNRPLLERLKVAADAEVLVVGADGEILAGTFGEREGRQAARIVAHAAGRIASADAPPSLETVSVGGQAYKFLWVPVVLDGTPSRTLAFFAPLAPIEADRMRMARTLALVALGGLVLMFVWGHVTTRSISRPIGQLVASTRAVADGDFQHRTARSRIPELHALSEAFDQMVTTIRQSEARLVRSERLSAMGRIAATVAHEVRNPLAAIRMLAQLLQRSHAEGTQPAEACRHIVTEIDRLEMLVKGLLDATHTGPLRRRPVQVATLLQEIAALTDEQLRHRRIILGVQFEPHLPEISADSDRLKQVILNLVQNAADAMPHGGPLSVTARRAARTGDAATGIEMVVADAGTGLSGDARTQAFEPFFSTKPDGAGLGLPLCRRIVEEHGGRITLANRPDGGAVATVWLPASPADRLPVGETNGAHLSR